MMKSPAAIVPIPPPHLFPVLLLGAAAIQRFRDEHRWATIADDLPAHGSLPVQQVRDAAIFTASYFLELSPYTQDQALFEAAFMERFGDAVTDSSHINLWQHDILQVNHLSGSHLCMCSAKWGYGIEHALFSPSFVTHPWENEGMADYTLARELLLAQRMIMDTRIDLHAVSD
jgi:hypothetical protein